MEQSVLISILGDRPIAYHPILAKAFGSVKAAVFLSQLLYWHGKGKYGEWTYKTANQFYEETGLSRREQESARKLLKKKGVLEEKRAGVPARLHFRVGIERLIEVVGSYNNDMVQTRFDKSAKLDSTKAPNKSGGKGESIPEITPETTSETTNIPPTAENFSPPISEKEVTENAKQTRCGSRDSKEGGLGAESSPESVALDLQGMADTEILHREEIKGHSSETKSVDPLLLPFARATEEARRREGNWTVPAEAGGDDPWGNGPVDALCKLTGTISLFLSEKERRDWARKFEQIGKRWSSDNLIVTPELMTAAIGRMKDSGLGFKIPNYTSPFAGSFERDIRTMLHSTATTVKNPTSDAYVWNTDSDPDAWKRS